MVCIRYIGPVIGVVHLHRLGLIVKHSLRPSYIKEGTALLAAPLHSAPRVSFLILKASPPVISSINLYDSFVLPGFEPLSMNEIEALVKDKSVDDIISEFKGMKLAARASTFLFHSIIDICYFPL